jgi:PspA-Associated protein
VIVRIATNGQYVLDEDQASKLNELDNQAVEAVDAGDQERFQGIFDEMLALVRAAPPLDGDELSESDVILPPPDLTFAEAGAEFTGEGLIPG